MRKGCSKTTEKAPTAGTIITACTELLQQNEAYRFIQHIRGSYPYWEKTLSDLNAMVRQLGIPTWFITQSAADLRWPETIQIIARRYGENLTVEDVANMDWQERCSWIRRNPVTAARHFDYRVQHFLHGVLLSAAQPVGHIEDYFIRVEFQQRGSPHIHGLFWIKGAPRIGKQSDADICAFIDTYISTQLPDNDEELHQLVTSLQTHSHSSTCRKCGKSCRFHFPRPPTNNTIISHPLTVDDVNPEHMKLQKEFNAQILKLVYDKLEDSCDKPLQDILASTGVSSEQYMEALDRSASSTSIITKKTPSETSINNYNPQLLKIWQANMDIQYVTDPLSCARYILSYISKGERHMGKLLKEAAKEVTPKNDSIRKQMKQVGNVFLNHREVSAQEAVYRLLSIPLKRSSRQVNFVSTGSPESRIHILKPTKALQMLPKDSEDIFQHGMIDRYAARPPSLHSMCLADFASFYRVDYVASKKDVPEDEIKNEDDSAGAKITLQNGMGAMKKRTRRIIIRTPRFSKVKTPEKYYRCILMLYLPWVNEHQDLLNGCDTYEAHYHGSRHTVDANMSIFEHNAEELDDAFSTFDHSKADSAWDAIASETQHQVEDQIEEGKLLDEACLDPGQLMGLHSLPELDCSSDVPVYSVEIQTDRLTTEEYNSIVQSLNQKQRHLFDHMLDWSRQNVQKRSMSQIVQPFHTFLSGGAGTGKSHLIKAVVSMMRRELQTVCESPGGVTVLLTAPTGCAATNIDATTLHQTLSIPVQQNSKHGEYQPLSNDKLATLRFHLQSLKVLIIDEISMVGLPMIWYIHRRLQDVMGSKSDDVYFGGVSVLAVGDLFQLQPVRQRPVYGVFQDPYARLNPTHIWQDIFQLFELSEVMRQKDDLHLAELLNRVRLANSTNADIEVLQACEISRDDKNDPINALHVYPTNFQVDQHNNELLQTLLGPLRNIKAKDTKKGALTGKAEMNIPDNPSQTGGLRQMLTVAEGARVMLIKNIDVADGLVNGAQGTIVGFLDPCNDHNADFPLAIMVQFDKASVGKNLRVKFKKPPDSPIPIQPNEARFSVGRYSQAEVIRKQFPLTLCFAATIHKVQGISVSAIVVSFDGQYHGGQAYVALSRCTSLAGLHLQHFDKKKIIASKSVEHEMSRLRQEKSFTPDSMHGYADFVAVRAVQYMPSEHTIIACSLQRPPVFPFHSGM